MRKSIFILAALCTAVFANAQTFKIISRSNDTIRLQSNKLGDALKSVVPNKSSEVDNNYRLIEKVENNKKSLLFVEFTQVLDKIFVTYETDLIHAGDWSIKAYSFADIFNSVKRENAILLKGQLLGMDIDIYQRPDNFKDIIRIDGIEFPSPVKVLVFENKITQEIQNKKNEKNIDMVKLALIEEDIIQTKGKANECYIAYLLLTGKFDNSADRTLMNDLCNQDEAMSLKAKYNELQLKYLSQGHDNRLNKYEK
jgi:hypothetical protein